jgi:DNA replication and repair protein RecF
VALDDLASELDAAHQQTVIDWLGGDAEQVLISGLEIPACLQSSGRQTQVFHVEHGTIRSLL